jgi:hypothetical protein
VKIGGVSTNFRMPDVLSIGLGGGSLVDPEACTVGPLSVGYKLEQEAQVFGGKSLTATDIAVMAGMVTIGTCQPTTNLTPHTVSAIVKKMHSMAEEAADRIKVTNEKLPILLVGGGSILINSDSSEPFIGASSVSKPPYYEVANAVGAALSQVSGSVDFVVSLEEKPRHIAISEAEDKAKRLAIEAGAVMESVQIVEIKEIPLTYIPNNTVRLQVRAVGDLALSNTVSIEPQPQDQQNSTTPTTINSQNDGHDIDKSLIREPVTSISTHSKPTNEPKSKNIDATTGDWILNQYDIECIAVGAGILGCGGGGNPALGRLRCLQALKQGYEMKVISSDRLGRDSGLSGLVVPVALMGAPTILVEKLCSGEELKTGLSVQQKLLNAGKKTDSGYTRL